MELLWSFLFGTLGGALVGYIVTIWQRGSALKREALAAKAAYYARGGK